MRDTLVNRYYNLLEKGIRPLVGTGVTPNAISFTALAVSFLAAVCYASGRIFQAGLLLILSGFLDTVDGSLARITGRVNRSGALLDSTLDRYAEFFIFSGLLLHYRREWMFAVVLLALMGSMMVSYIKARAQSLGRIRTVGLMQRPERLALLVAGSLLNGPMEFFLPGRPDSALSAAVILLALLANTTALRRLAEGRKDLAGNGDPSTPP